ncbi:MAG: rubrerythrin family protein [Methanobacteriota archaeon]|nr:MAG: rubrerythrin family protein [Euryarchaeota archaeon]
MHKMTKQNLEEAYAGESQAYMKYSIWADRAEKDGKPSVARLFRAVAAAEKVHATNHWRVLGNIGDTDANLEHAVEGENYEIEEMYPAFEAVAEHQGEKNALRSIHFAFEVEKAHAKLYAKAKEAVYSGMDAEIGDLHVCPVCGYTVEGNPSDTCPVCGAKKEIFSRF